MVDILRRYLVGNGRPDKLEVSETIAFASKRSTTPERIGAHDIEQYRLPRSAMSNLVLITKARPIPECSLENYEQISLRPQGTFSDM